MEKPPHDLDYLPPTADAPPRWGGFVRVFGLLFVAGGLVTVGAGFNGPDEMPLILVGGGVTAFGILCAILGQILHVLERDA